MKPLDLSYRLGIFSFNLGWGGNSVSYVNRGTISNVFHVATLLPAFNSYLPQVLPWRE
jgi:hypothetical protein